MDQSNPNAQAAYASQSNPDSQAAYAGPPIRMLLLAAFMPFGVIGLLASPLAFNALRHLAGL